MGSSSDPLAVLANAAGISLAQTSTVTSTTSVPSFASSPAAPHTFCAALPATAPLALKSTIPTSMPVYTTTSTNTNTTNGNNSSSNNNNGGLALRRHHAHNLSSSSSSSLTSVLPRFEPSLSNLHRTASWSSFSSLPRVIEDVSLPPHQASPSPQPTPLQFQQQANQPLHRKALEQCSIQVLIQHCQARNLPVSTTDDRERLITRLLLRGNRNKGQAVAFLKDTVRMVDSILIELGLGGLVDTGSIMNGIRDERADTDAESLPRCGPMERLVDRRLTAVHQAARMRKKQQQLQQDDGTDFRHQLPPRQPKKRVRGACANATTAVTTIKSTGAGTNKKQRASNASIKGIAADVVAPAPPPSSFTPMVKTTVVPVSSV